MERNILLTIAYDGSMFHGWQKQPEAKTVQGYLEQTMSRLFDREILLSGTSRTDAGVHAWGQRASFKADLGIPIEKMALVINNALCAREGSEGGRGGFAKSPIRILKAEEVSADFHARFNSKGKKYVYKICAVPGSSGATAYMNPDVTTDEIADGRDGSGRNHVTCMWEQEMSKVFRRNYVYHVDESLDVCAMHEAAQYFEGEHDFKSFEAAGGNPRETTVRRMFSAKVVTVPGISVVKTTDAAVKAADAAGGMQHIEFTIEGDGFLYNMVRIMTGTLVEVGQGKRRPEEIKDIIEAKGRQKAGHTAPPNGLYLAEVYY